MKRRQFLTAVAAALTLPATTRAASLKYRPGDVDTGLAAGKTLFLDFYAYWCPTCVAQHRIIDAARAKTPAYDAAITFVEIDWDRYQAEALAKRLKVYSRGTLIVLKGEAELGRLVYDTNAGKIQALLATALAAATA
jgi:thiol-disulfide isomerase/thioredoxin